MATETNLDATAAIAQLTAQGAARTEVVLIQHDPATDLFNCSMVARGFDASNNIIQDIVLCPSPCRVGQAFNTGT